MHGIVHPLATDVAVPFSQTFDACPVSSRISKLFEWVADVGNS